MTEPEKRRAEASRRSTLVVTNLTKVAGIALGVHAGFSPTPDSRVIALAAFMLAGAQVSETLLLSLIDRFFGRPPGE